MQKKDLSAMSVLPAILASAFFITLCGISVQAKSINDLDLLAPDAQMTNPQTFTPPAITNDNNTLQPLADNSQLKPHTSKRAEKVNSKPLTLNDSLDNSTVQADQKIQTATEKNDEMELNNEVDSLEQYGDAAAAQTARKDAKQLAQEDWRLKHEALVLKHRRALMVARNHWLQRVYEKRMIQVVLARKKADIASRALQNQTRKVDHLRAQVDIKNTLIARDHARERGDLLRERAAIRREHFELHRIALLNHWNYLLKAHLAKLKRAIRRREKHNAILRARELRLSRIHSELHRKWLSSYRKYHRLAER